MFTRSPAGTQLLETVERECWNRSGETAAVGDVMKLDVLNSDGDSDFPNQFDVIDPPGTLDENDILVVVSKLLDADDPGGDDTKVLCTFMGPCKVLAGETDASAIGKYLVSDAGGVVHATLVVDGSTAANTRVLGMARAAMTDTALFDCEWWGGRPPESVLQ